MIKFCAISTQTHWIGGEPMKKYSFMFFMIIILVLICLEMIFKTHFLFIYLVIIVIIALIVSLMFVILRCFYDLTEYFLEEEE